MGLMDKVKAQANQLAQKTQEAAQEGKAKIDQAQANRRGDALLRQLGAAVFAERTGRGTPDSQAKIEELISAISAHERENGLNLASPRRPCRSLVLRPIHRAHRPAPQGRSTRPRVAPRTQARRSRRRAEARTQACRFRHPASHSSRRLVTASPVARAGTRRTAEHASAPGAWSATDVLRGGPGSRCPGRRRLRGGRSGRDHGVPGSAQHQADARESGDHALRGARQRLGEHLRLRRAA